MCWDCEKNVGLRIWDCGLRIADLKPPRKRVSAPNAINLTMMFHHSKPYPPRFLVRFLAQRTPGRSPFDSDRPGCGCHTGLCDGFSVMPSAGASTIRGSWAEVTSRLEPPRAVRHPSTVSPRLGMLLPGPGGCYSVLRLCRALFPARRAADVGPSLVTHWAERPVFAHRPIANPRHPNGRRPADR